MEKHYKFIDFEIHLGLSKKPELNNELQFCAANQKNTPKFKKKQKKKHLRPLFFLKKVVLAQHASLNNLPELNPA